MSLYTPFTSHKGKCSPPQKRTGDKHLSKKMRVFMNGKAGENSRNEQARKPLGQKEKNMRKLGGDV